MERIQCWPNVGNPYDRQNNLRFSGLCRDTRPWLISFSLALEASYRTKLQRSSEVYIETIARTVLAAFLHLPPIPPVAYLFSR
jgi:hypothetical protein